MAVSMDEVNFLVWKYLQENGFPHSAFVFETESFADSVQLAGSEIPPNALLTLLQRSLLELKLEHQILQAQRDPDFQAAQELNQIQNSFPATPRPPPIIPAPCSSISIGSTRSRPPLYISQATATIFNLKSIIIDIKWSPPTLSTNSLLIVTADGTACFYTSPTSSIPIAGHYTSASWFSDGSGAILAGQETSAIVSSSGKVIQQLPFPLIALATAPSSPQFVSIAPDGSASLHNQTGTVLKRFTPFPRLSIVTWKDDALFAIGGPDGAAICAVGGETTILSGAGSVKQFSFSNATFSALLALLTENGVEIWRGNQRLKQLNFSDPVKATVIAWQNVPTTNTPILLIGISSVSESSNDNNFGNALLSTTTESDPIEICKLAGRPTTISTTPGKIAVGMDSGEVLIIGAKESVCFSRKRPITQLSWAGKNIAISFDEPLAAIISTDAYLD